MPTRSSLLALLACLLLVPAAASAAPGDLEPYSFADGIEAGGEVNATQVIGDRVFVGGSFSFAGPLTGHLAFAGAADGAIGASPHFDNVVRTAVADGAGGWYLGGAFSHVDGAAVDGLAHLKADGTVDAGFPQVAGGEPLALLLDAGKLYVGGNFTTLGGLARRGLARIDTATGAVEGWDPGCETVLAMALAGESLYVGSATQGTQVCGGSNHDYAHKLSTATGAADDTFAPAPNSMVRAVAVSGGAVYIGGSFSTPRPRLAKVDAGTGALDASFHPVFANSNGVYTMVPDGPGQLLVGGGFDSVDGVTGTANLARISTTGVVDTTFKPTVRGGDVHVVVRDGNAHLYVGGTFSQNNAGSASPIIGGAYREHVARLDATTGQADNWQADANGMIGAIAVAGDRVLLGGFQDITGGALRHGLAAFDRVSGKLLGADAQLNGSIDQLVQAGGALYALGSFSSSGELARHGLVKLAPATGAADPSWNPGDGQGGASAIAATPDALYVGGYFEGAATIGGASPDYLARLALDGSGAADTSFDAQLDGGVDDLAAGGSAVYASGPFTHAGGAARAGLAKLAAADGAVGTSLAAGADNDITTIALHDGKLYIGGAFSSFAGQPRAYLARVDGASGALDEWNPGANGGVESIAFAPGTVFLATGPDVWPGPAVMALSTESGAAAAGFPGGTVDYASSVAYAGQTLYVGGSAGGDARRFWILRTRAPHATAAPALAGDALAGATQTCSDGAWSAEPASLSRRWLRDGSPIDGATGSEYVATGADAGHALACEVTAANERGSDAATSGAVTVKDVTPPATGPNDGGHPIVTPPATASKVKKASCKVRKGAVRCTLTFDGTPRKVSAKLLLGTKVVAKAGGSKALTFKARKRLKPGRYTLVIAGGAKLRVTVKR